MPASTPAPESPTAENADDLRARILAAAIELITTGGREAATTRAIAAAAGVQPPALYRQFGDMRGVLDAAARAVLAEYVGRKANQRASHDPLEDLRRGWDRHVAFGIANPAVYALIYGEPGCGPLPTAAREGEVHLHALVARVAAAGRLRVSVPHAARLIAAAGNGVTLALIATPEAERDPRLATAMREAVLAAIVTDAAPDERPARRGAPGGVPGRAQVTARAVALHAALAESPEAAAVLSPGERHLMTEWLHRLADAGP